MILKAIINFFIALISSFLNVVNLPVLEAATIPVGILDTVASFIEVACYILPVGLCLPLIHISFSIVMYLAARAVIKVIINIVHLIPFI